MITLKKYEPTTLTNLGTVRTLVGKKGTVKFSGKNFNNPNKRVVVIVQNEAGESGVISCSSEVSALLRKMKAEGQEEIKAKALVVGLPILQNEDGAYFISRPGGGEAVSGTMIGDLDEVEAPELVTPEALLGW